MQFSKPLSVEMAPLNQRPTQQANGKRPGPSKGLQVATRLEKIERKIPVLLDLVEDRVHWRSLTVLCFLIIIGFVLRAGLYQIFLPDPKSEANNEPFVLDLQNEKESFLTQFVPSAGTGDVEIGEKVWPPPVLSVLSQSGDPLPNITVTAYLEPATGFVHSWLMKQFENTTADYTGIPYAFLCGGITDKGYPPKAMQVPRLSGNVLTSSATGRVEFRDLKVVFGSQGRYYLKFRSNMLTSNRYRLLVLSSSVSTVEIVEDLPYYSAMRTPIPPFSVRIRDNKGLPVSGKTALIVSSPVFADDVTFAVFEPYFLYPKFLELQNVYSTISDQNGLATFYNVTILGSTMPGAKVAFVVDGIVSENRGRVRLFDTVSTVEIVQQADSSVMEGQAFVRQPMVKVKDGQGKPVPGVIVFAGVYSKDGLAQYFLLSPETVMEMNSATNGPAALGNAKHVRNFASLPADANGIARFSNLSFTTTGEAGEYQLSFGTNFVQSAPSKTIQVLSSVASVEFVVQPAFKELQINSSELFRSGDPLGTLGLPDMIPPFSLVVKNSAGEPLMGKRVTFIGYSASHKSSSYRLRVSPQPFMLFSDVNGVISLTNDLLAFTADGDQLSAAQQRGYANSNLRVLSGTSTTDFQFRAVVEGITSSFSRKLTLQNLDPPDLPICSFLDWTVLPDKFNVHQRHDVQLRAINSHGMPVPDVEIKVVHTETFGMAEFMEHRHFGIAEYYNDSSVGVNDTLSQNILGMNPYATAQLFGPRMFEAPTWFFTLLQNEYFPLIAEGNRTNSDGFLDYRGVGVDILWPTWMTIVAMGGCELQHDSLNDQLYAQYLKAAPKPRYSRCCFADVSPKIPAANWGHLDLVQAPGKCVEIGKAFDQPIIFRLTDMNGNPTVGARGRVIVAIDRENEYFPSFIDMSEVDNLLLLPATSKDPILLGSAGSQIFGGLSDVTAVTNSSGYGVFNNVHLKTGYPGNYLLLVMAGGAVEGFASLTGCPNPVQKLDYSALSHTQVAAAASCTEDCFEDVPAYMIEKFDIPVTRWPRRCPDGIGYLPCIPGDPNQNWTRVNCDWHATTCSGHGKCACGVCACDRGWEGTPNCQTRRTEDYWSLKYSPLPVLPVHVEIPAWMFGDVRVFGNPSYNNSKPLEPLNGCQVKAVLMNCDGTLADAEIRLEEVKGYDDGSNLNCPRNAGTPVSHRLQSVPSGSGYAPWHNSSIDPLDGLAHFWRGKTMKYYLTRAATGCYRFQYAFAGNSSGNSRFNVAFDPLEGAVLSDSMSNPFLVVNRFSDIKFVSKPSLVTATNDPLMKPFQLLLTTDGSATYQKNNWHFLMQLFDLWDNVTVDGILEGVELTKFTNQSVYDDIVSSPQNPTHSKNITREVFYDYVIANGYIAVLPSPDCDPYVSLQGNTYYMCDAGVGPIARVTALNAAGKRISLVRLGYHSDCARMNSSGYAEFDALQFPAWYVDHIEGLNPVYKPLSTGLYFLEFDVFGLRKTYPIPIQVSATPAIIEILSFPDKATIFRDISGIGAIVMISTGSPIPSAVVSASVVPVLPENDTSLVPVELDPETSACFTDTNGKTTFPGLRFIKGRTGRYSITFTAGSVHVARNITLENPVKMLNVSYVVKNLKLPKVDAVVSKVLPGDIHVCAVAWNSSLLPNVTMESSLVSVSSETSALEAFHGTDLDFGRQTLTTDASGCLILRGLTFKSASHSANFSMLFDLDGVLSSPLNVTLLTFQDANPWSLQGLESIMFSPLAVLVPLLLANSLYFRDCCRMTSIIVSLLFGGLWLAGSAATFTKEEDSISEHFEPLFVTFVLWMSITFYVLLSIALVALAVLCVKQCFKMRRIRSAKKYSAKNGRRRTVKKAGSTSNQGFFGEKMKAYERYAFEKCCGLVKPLLIKGKLSPEFAETLEEIFERHSPNSKPPSWAKRLLTKYFPHASGLETKLTLGNPHSINTLLLKAQFGELGASPEGGKKLVMMNEWKAILDYRLAVQGPIKSIRDLMVLRMPLSQCRQAIIYKSVSAAGLQAVGGFGNRRQSTRAGALPLPKFSTEWNPQVYALSFDLLQRSVQEWWSSTRAEHANASSAPTLENVYRIVCGGTLFSATATARDFYKTYQERLCRCVDPPIHSPTDPVWSHRTVDSPDSGFEEFLETEETMFGGGMAHDSSVWREILCFGYTHKLALNLLDGKGGLASKPMKVLKQEFCLHGKSERDDLTHEELSSMMDAALAAFVDSSGGSEGMAVESNLVGPVVSTTEATSQHKISLSTYNRVRTAHNGEFGSQAFAHWLTSTFRNPEVKLFPMLKGLGYNRRLQKKPDLAFTATFFPQRLLIAFGLSILLCIFIGVYMLSVSYRLELLISDGWNRLMRLQAETKERFESMAATAASTVEDMYTSSLLEVQSTLGAGEITANAFGDKLTSTFHSAAAAQTISAGGAATQAAVDSAKSVTDQALAQSGFMSDITAHVQSLMSSISIEQYEPLKNQIQTNLGWAAIGGGVIALLCVLLIWFSMVSNFEKRMILARRGQFMFIRKKTLIGKSFNYIGIQVAQSMIGYIFFFVPWSIVVFLLQWPSARMWLYEFIKTKILALFGSALLIKIFQHFLMKFLTGGGVIRHRRIFMLYELLQTFLNMVTGFALAIMRVVYILLFAGLLFIRPDVSQLPAESQHMDPATASYNAVCLIDMEQNHPLKRAFAELMIRLLKRKRQEKKRKMSMQRDGAVRVSERALRRKRIRNRLWLWITLHNNPQLRVNRRTELPDDGDEESMLQKLREGVMGGFGRLFKKRGVEEVRPREAPTTPSSSVSTENPLLRAGGGGHQ